MKKIWLAGGCFWGVEAYFQQLKGVIATTVGYGQGNSEQPFYQEVCTGTTGHAEICEVDYDETRLSLEKILEHYFPNYRSYYFESPGTRPGNPIPNWRVLCQ